MKWFSVMASSDLEPGQVVEISHGGDDLLLYRSSEGVCHAVTAYCPHMNNYMPNGLAPGASLNRLLNDDLLHCPFHGWAFNAAGQCVSVPSGQRVPVAMRSGRAVLRRWPVREREGRLEIADKGAAGA
jgi:3-ketosteroid 9alpha-monooxygenase subunit A